MNLRSKEGHGRCWRLEKEVENNVNIVSYLYKNSHIINFLKLKIKFCKVQMLNSLRGWLSMFNILLI